LLTSCNHTDIDTMNTKSAHALSEIDRRVQLHVDSIRNKLAYPYNDYFDDVRLREKEAIAECSENMLDIQDIDEKVRGLHRWQKKKFRSLSIRRAMKTLKLQGQALKLAELTGVREELQRIVSQISSVSVGMPPSYTARQLAFHDGKRCLLTDGSWLMCVFNSR
jgi:hypothetical protein